MWNDGRIWRRDYRESRKMSIPATRAPILPAWTKEDVAEVEENRCEERLRESSGSERRER